MARRKYKERLILKNEIQEQMRLIDGSATDYVTPSGNIYKLIENDMFIKKSTFVNKHNGYLYSSITLIDKQVQRRVHILVAKAYVENPNPEEYTMVLHKDNDKQNPHYLNLCWGNASTNGKQAFRDGLSHNDSGYDDSQSMPVVQIDMNGNLVKRYGSVSIAAKETGYTKTGILFGCKHKIKSKPRKGYYFRFQSEYDCYGFVL